MKSTCRCTIGLSCSGEPLSILDNTVPTTKFDHCPSCGAELKHVTLSKVPDAGTREIMLTNDYTPILDDVDPIEWVRVVPKLKVWIIPEAGSLNYGDRMGTVVVVAENDEEAADLIQEEVKHLTGEEIDLEEAEIYEVDYTLRHADLFEAE